MNYLVMKGACSSQSRARAARCARCYCRSERAVNCMVKRTAKKAGINEDVSTHRLRHAHGSHAIDRLPEVQATLGHGNISE
jgi:site-specific recombinase XerD